MPPVRLLPTSTLAKRASARLGSALARLGVSVRSLPNLLTGGRIGLAVVVFALLAAGSADPAWLRPFALCGFFLFVAAAATDYFDGWLARRLQAQSAWGAALDPIADKIAVLAVLLGLTLVRPRPVFAAAGFLILFREVFVSGLREAGAGRSVTLPVTRLAKWKTTVQLIALSVELLALAYTSLWVRAAGDALLWLATGMTLWTGVQYARAFHRAAR